MHDTDFKPVSGDILYHTHQSKRAKKLFVLGYILLFSIPPGFSNQKYRAMEKGSSLELLIPRLLQGSEDDYLALFDKPDAVLDDVFAGQVQGNSEALLAFRTDFAARLGNAQAWVASLHTLRATNDVQTPRIAVEQVLPLLSGWAWDSCKGGGLGNSSTELLVTMVADVSPAGLLRSVRLYYPSYPITGQAHVRKPILATNSSAHLTGGAVARYQQALGAGLADVVAAQFEPDGYFREPSGVYHSGFSNVLRNFQAFFKFGRGGGIDLKHCSLITDGKAVVLEYNCVSWGGVVLTPTAGVAVYELGRHGLIMGGRVNDNVQPPVADV